jgi:hypothetical protein
MALEIGTGITIGGGISLVPEAGPVPTPVGFLNPSIETFNIGNEYGWKAGSFGALSSYPPMMSGIWYDSGTNESYMQFVNGPWTPYFNTDNVAVVVTDSALNNMTTIKASLDGVTYVTSTSAQTHIGGVKFVFAGDPWGLVAQGSSGNLSWADVSYLDDGSPRPVALGTVTFAYDDLNDPAIYGFSAPSGGSTTVLPNMLKELFYSTTTTNTTVQLFTGDFSNNTANVYSDIGVETINGSGAVSVTVNGVTQSGTLVSGSGGPKLVVSGDVYSIQTNLGNPFDMVIVGG